MYKTASIRTGLTFTGLALAVLSSAAHAKDTAAQIAARKEIATNYARYNQAMKKGDVNTMMSFLAPDYQHYTFGGNRQDRATFENTTRNMWKLGLPIRISRLDTTIQNVQWRGPDAIVSVRVDMVTGMHNGRAKPIVARTTERHYWSPGRTGWKLRQVVELTAQASNPFG